MPHRPQRDVPKSTCLGEDQSGSTHSGLPNLKSMRKDLFGDIHFFQTDLGVIVGSVGLLILWLLLAGRGYRIGNLIAGAIKQPLLLGLGASLYLGWFSRLIIERIAPFDERSV